MTAEEVCITMNLVSSFKLAGTPDMMVKLENSIRYDRKDAGHKGNKMADFMLDIGSHLCIDLWMTLKRKNNIFNVISIPKLVENEILHYILGLLCRKLQIQAGQRRPF